MWLMDGARRRKQNKNAEPLNSSQHEKGGEKGNREGEMSTA